MLWDKHKYVINIRGGKGKVNTSGVKGIISHIIVKPKTEETMWDLKIIDKDGDEIYDVRDKAGRWDDKEGLPVGKDSQEKLTIVMEQVTKNENIDIILKVRESV